MPHVSPVRELKFLLETIVGYNRLSETETFAEATPDVTDAVLSEVGRLCDEVLAPLQRAGDLHPAALENGVVKTSPGYAEGYAAIAEGGWVGLTGNPEYGGMGLPIALNMAVQDMIAGACLSLQLCPMLSQGQIEALEKHADEALKALYLPKLISGEWTGTMNLTEPQAGSDVGALKSRAVDNGDGTFAVTGQKIFISWGDHDLTENVCHLVLARLPDAVPGTKGISLFLVPKFIPDNSGAPGPRNSLSVVSLEHKMGLHGSPTAVMQFDGATGWLVGPENGGMAAMFTMMNNARLGVGIQALGVAGAACQKSLEFAAERKQGKTADGSAAILGHADVRRMVLAMTGDVFSARAIALDCAVSLDLASTGDPAARARAALLTPIAKAFGTDTGIWVSQEAVQVHGGMGVIEETGVAQYYRDVRVTAIYEGTNGIQAMDLVGRKLSDDGEAAFALLDEIETDAEKARRSHPTLSDGVWNAAANLRETTEWMLKQPDLNDRFAGAVPYLRGWARVLGGHYHLRAALSETQPGPRTRIAEFYVGRLLPEHLGLLEAARGGAAGLYALDPDDLVA